MKNENKKNEIAFTLLVLTNIIVLFVGNRIFNHIDPWLGISFIMLLVAYINYKFLKRRKNEND